MLKGDKNEIDYSSFVSYLFSCNDWTIEYKKEIKMRQIIVVIDPFLQKQKFYVFQNGIKIVDKKGKIEDIGDIVINLCNTHEASKVTLKCDNKPYARKYIQEIKKKEITNFKGGSLRIDLI